MKLPLVWLKDYIKVKEKPEELANLLSLSGSEVEYIQDFGDEMGKVVVGEILEIKPHPKANRLLLAKVDIGRKKLDIVCGAPNIRVGQKVPVALVGAKLANGMVIEKVAIRGEESEGMLCAEDELGLGEDHSGIMVLDKSAKIGQKFSEIYGSKEPVLDLAITNNRADCFSILGLAREIGALTGESVNWPDIRFNKTVKKDLDIKVKVTEEKLCPKYTVRIIRNIAVKESPQWLKERLLAVGLRPINNVVDVTNFVMMEMGQPLHAFDLDKVKEIEVRKAKKGEKIKTIDNEERELDNDMLVITDGKEPIAIAGVMGGLDSEVTNKTTDVLLESAQFDSVSVRLTAQKLNLRSEASNRFEKGIDWQITEKASDRAASLIAELGEGEVVSDQLVAASRRFEPTVIELSLPFLNNLLGIDLSKSEVLDKLTALGFEARDDGQELKVTVPSWRSDVKIPVDLVEEVGRLYDYNKLKPTYLKAQLMPVALSLENKLIRQTQDILAGAGFTEVLNYSFYGQLPDCCGPEDHLAVANPLNPDQRYLRLDLEPRIKDNIAKNIREFDQVKIFEIGTVYLSHKGDHLPKENKMLAVAYATKKLKLNEALSYLKGVASLLFKELSIEDNKINFSLLKGDYTGVKIDYDNNFLGTIIFNSELSYGLLRLEVKELVNIVNKIKIYWPIAKYPSIVRDIALELADEILYREVESLVRETDSLIVKVDHLSTYPLEKQKKSLAIRIVFQSLERTLESREVDEIQQKIMDKLTAKFKAKLR